MASVYKRSCDKARKGGKWRISWFDAELNKWRDRTGYTDREASLRKGERLERESGRRAEGITDPMDEHQRRPIGGHLADFIAKVRAGERDGLYVMQLENRIQRIIDGTEAKRVHDLDPVRVGRFLGSLRTNKGRALSGITKNEYVGCVKAFTRWAVAARRIAIDPLASLKRVERKAIKPTHPRRALAVPDLANLLDVAERRPVRELLTIRHGPRKGEQTADVRPEVIERARLIGQHRRVAYMLAIWAGLRRAEISALAWGDLELDGVIARIRLRAETTKSRRADTLVIHPQLAEELRAIRPANAEANTPVVGKVPGMKAWRADLRAAGIEYGDARIGYADLHALRKTLSTMLAAAGVTPRVRQAHLRHTDPRLTEVTYMDESLLPIAAELAKVPAIPKPKDTDPSVIPLRMTGTDDRQILASAQGNRAGLMQESCGPTGQNGARCGNVDGTQEPPMRMSQALDTARDDNGWHCQAQKRVMGLEPTTSTLAT